MLGCDGSYPGPHGAASGYLVRAGRTTVWLDAGPGTFANLQVHVDPGQVDAVVLSHEHPDHWTDLESFAVWAKQHSRRRTPVYAPPGLRARSYFADEPLLEWGTVEPADVVSVGDLAVRFVATDHGPPTVAARFDAAGAASGGPEAALAYSADSGPDWSVEELGRGLGTLLCEATYTRAFEGRFRHLSGRQAGEMAAAAGVRRLVTTHRWPTVSAEQVATEAAEAFGGPVGQASVGAVFEW